MHYQGSFTLNIVNVKHTINVQQKELTKPTINISVIKYMTNNNTCKMFSVQIKIKRTPVLYKSTGLRGSDDDGVHQVVIVQIRNQGV